MSSIVKLASDLFQLVRIRRHRQICKNLVTCGENDSAIQARPDAICGLPNGTDDVSADQRSSIRIVPEQQQLNPSANIISIEVDERT